LYIDMHVHSKRSDDAGGTVEGYLKWINVLRKKGLRVDGFVLTEHRTFNVEADYTDISRQYDTLVLKGSEIETDLGHVLVYGVTPWLLNQFDFTNIKLSAKDVFDAAKEAGGYAVAAHPGRTRIGLWQHVQSGVTLPDIQTIELLNGGSNNEENGLSRELAKLHGFSGVGGSDSHYVSTIGKYITNFYENITSLEDLIFELSQGQFNAVELEDTRQGE
jgi:predicted metal-dependent phosphoesterase TrpH